MTAVTPALDLSTPGHSIVLPGADEIGSGSTGDSTGDLYGTFSRGMIEGPADGPLQRWFPSRTQGHANGGDS